MIGYIYKTINLINNKIYIGKHQASIFEPEKYIGSGRLLQKAIKKYGKNNFSCELIEWCETIEQLNEREIYWITYYKTNKDFLTYNLAKGGEGGVGRCSSDPNFYWNILDKRQLVLSKASKSLKKYFKAHPEAHLGINNPMYGKHHSELAKQKISNKLKNSNALKKAKRFSGKHHSDKTKKELSAWGKSKRWINNGVISTYILENEPLPGGFVFGRLLSEETKLRNEYFKDKNFNSNNFLKRVFCVELNLIFDSISQASKSLNIKSSHISLCCHGKQNKAGGYHWRFVDDQNIVRYICCCETSRLYRTLSEAALATGANASKICECCNGKRKTSGNFHWKYVEIKENLQDEH